MSNRVPARRPADLDGMFAFVGLLVLLLAIYWIWVTPGDMTPSCDGIGGKVYVQYKGVDEEHGDMHLFIEPGDPWGLRDDFKYWVKDKSDFAGIIKEKGDIALVVVERYMPGDTRNEIVSFKASGNISDLKTEQKMQLKVSCKK